jgi:enoyl-CoA hydratase/carnithine racemase
VEEWDMPTEILRFETAEPGIAVLTMNRPERLNALNGPLLDALADAVQRIAADDAIRVFVLRGAARADGRPCFSAGVDLRAFAEGAGVGIDQGFRLTQSIEDLAKPSIAVIDGICTTGAAEIAVACHLRLVGAGARISDWHLKNLGTGLGAWGAATRWARLVGSARARELFLTGREIGAEEAVRIGFASAAHPSEQLFGEALAVARAIAAMDPRGVALTLAHLGRTDDWTREESLRFARLAPRWYGVGGDIAGKRAQILSKK